jgi:peptidyl-prolyl cis-trans isomerase B (cyclophilin B)
LNNWKKYITLLITFILFINICLILPTGGNKFYFSNTIIVPDDYQTIQEAIDNSKKGDIIYVKNGIYCENLIIEKSIKLIGEDKNTTIIDGFQNKSVIKILSDNVFVNDFTIQNSSTSSFEYAGIESYSSNNYFVRNIIKNNKYGINSFDGNNNTIMYNFLNNNKNDSLLINSPYNVIYRNHIEDNAGGIFLKINATNNEIKQNNFINNTIYNANFYKAKFNDWNQNYWDDWIGLKYTFLKFLPKLIITNSGIIPIINFDWYPVQEKYIINSYPIAIMDTNMGVMTIELVTDKMPITTDNFIKLANDKFFENIVFHRVIDDFVIQGGGYYANGTNKRSPYGTIKLETHPDILHVDGAISMARTIMPNSATSQFFICDGPSPHLDGNYAAFGSIIDGIEVLHAIAEVETTTKHGLDDWPVEDVIINSVTIEYL